MWKIAIRPKFIALLLLALVMAGLFGLLANWQLERAQLEAKPPDVSTEVVEPLTEVASPQKILGAGTSDKKVTLTGHFLREPHVIISDRLQDDMNGYWAVAAFEVEGVAPVDSALGAAPVVIPVVLGWSADQETAHRAEPPTGTVSILGRLVPTEGPVAASDAESMTFASLSVSQLINVWNVQSFGGFILPLEAASGTSLNGQVLFGNGSGLDNGRQLQQVPAPPPSQDQSINLLNLFYGIEWIIFAGFAVFLWLRLVHDEQVREREAADPDDDDDFLDDYDDEYYDELDELEDHRD